MIMYVWLSEKIKKITEHQFINELQACICEVQADENEFIFKKIKCCEGILIIFKRNEVISVYLKKYRNKIKM